MMNDEKLLWKNTLRTHTENTLAPEQTLERGGRIGGRSRSLVSRNRRRSVEYKVKAIDDLAQRGFDG